MKQIKFLSLAVCSLVFLSACGAAPQSEGDYFDNNEKITERALKTEDLAVCKELNSTGYYRNEENGEKYIGYPRLSCLEAYQEKFPSLEVCELIAEVGDYYAASVDCVIDLAESENDALICDQLSNDEARNRCLAYVEQDKSYCKGLSGQSEAWCITEVVKRNGDEWSCLDIGQQYGEGWERISNKCLEYAAYLLQEEGRAFQHVCELMISPVPGDEVLDFSSRDDCLDGKLNFSEDV